MHQSKAYSYNIITPAVNKPLSLTTVKSHLRIDGTAEDTFLNLLIDAVTAFGEKYTKRDFINKTYRTFRDFFPLGVNSFFYARSLYQRVLVAFELRRTKVSVVNSIKYFKNNVLTTVDTDIYNLTDVNDFAEIYLNDGKLFPTDEDKRLQAIQIEFVAGFGVTETEVPADVKLALLNHIADLYENRGDCNCDATLQSLSTNTRILYDKIRLKEIGA